MSVPLDRRCSSEVWRSATRAWQSRATVAKVRTQSGALPVLGAVKARSSSQAPARSRGARLDVPPGANGRPSGVAPARDLRDRGVQDIPIAARGRPRGLPRGRPGDPPPDPGSGPASSISCAVPRASPAGRDREAAAAAAAVMDAQAAEGGRGGPCGLRGRRAGRTPPGRSRRSGGRPGPGPAAEATPPLDRPPELRGRSAPRTPWRRRARRPGAPYQATFGTGPAATPGSGPPRHVVSTSVRSADPAFCRRPDRRFSRRR